MRNLLAGLLSAFVLAANAAPVVTPIPLTANGSLASPVEIAHAGDGSNRLFIVERAGRIRIFRAGALVATPFLDLTGLARVLSTGSEQGLLGLAFHPNYAENGMFYVAYTSLAQGPITAGSLVVASYARSNDPDVAQTFEQVIIAIPHPGQDNHNGGKIAFGPDGYLYVGTGDGGGGGDPLRNSQNQGNLLGKILRLQVDGRSAGYTIPPTNPNAGLSCTANRCPEIWAYGLRNPWRFSFDRATGDMLIGDVGQATIEEVDFQPAGVGGRNYGWGVFEGTNCFNDTYFLNVPGACAGLANHTPPILQYNHDSAGGFSITGGYRYRGFSSSPLRGYYLYGDIGTARVWAARPNVNGTWSTEEVIAPGAIAGMSAFGEDEQGELYLVTYSNGRLYALKGPAPAHVPDTDFSGEGRSDLLFVNPTTEEVGGWLMNGTAATSTQLLLDRLSGWTPIFTKADFNADGRSDIVWRQSDGSIAIWLMNQLGLAGSGLLLGPGTGWNVTHIGDFNADGRSDILWRHTDGRTALWLMNGTATIGSGLVYSDPAWTVTHVGDFDGDARSDLLWRHTDGSVAAWLMNGLVPTASGLVFASGNPWTVAFAKDLDGDGRADLLAQHTDGSWGIWLMNGLASTSNSVVLGAGSGWSATHVEDLDGDGDGDIVWRHADERVAAWLVQGTAFVDAAVLLGPATGWRVTHVRDLSGDGRADLVWHRQVTGSTAVWLMNGLNATSTAVIFNGGWVVAP